MIKSMTGFGRCLKETDQFRILAELKSVNHRYCEVFVRMPKKLVFFEQNVRTLLKQYAQRGKIDIFISYEDYQENTECVKYNAEIAENYVSCIRAISEQFGIGNDITAMSIARLPDVLSITEGQLDEKESWARLEPVLKEAFEAFLQSRLIEGERLRDDILEKLNGMLYTVDAIEERSPQILSEYREKIMQKVQELLAGASKVDESVLATEIVVFADKICVDEETVRLKSHIASMKNDLLSPGEAVGRKLDFIAQEMNREANTILSKANDIQVSNLAISLKTEIEKIREQIQNIE